MFKFIKPKKDERFLDPERLRYRSVLRSHPENLKRPLNEQERHLKVDFISGYQESVMESNDSWVTVERKNESSNQALGGFLQLINSESKHPYSVENECSVNQGETISLFDVEAFDRTKKIGVFSDSKIYSALIHTLIRPYDLNVGHFNHPNTFVSDNFPEFDDISAWIIFLSDEDESDFLDKFLSRYENKPTLFLFPKMERANCQTRINEFVLEHGFIEKEAANTN